MSTETWLWQDTRAAEPSGHFELALPSWMRPVDRPLELPTRESSPVSVATFRSIEGPRVEIEIVGLFVAREIAPADVLAPLLRGHTMLSQRRIPSEAGDLLDAETHRVLDTSYRSRWWTVKDGGSAGGRLFVLEARADDATYGARRDELFASISSFRLREPTPWPYFEEITSLARRAPNDFLVFYPDSWRLVVVNDADDGPFVAHLVQSIDGDVLGRMTVVSATGMDAAAVLETYDRSLRAAGAELEWQATEAVPAFGGLERAWRARARAALRPSGSAVDVEVYVGQKGRGSVLLGLAGAAPSIDPLAAASVARALEIARHTLSVA